MRKRSNTTFKANLFKLLTNSLYGRLLLNKEKFTRTLLCNASSLQKAINSPQFYEAHIINDNVASVKVYFNEILQNSPIIVGSAVLDYAKIEIYRFIYEYLKPSCNKYRICAIDTDGFIAQLDTSPEEFIQKYPEIFDTSNTFNPTHPLYHTHLKFLTGSWKIEIPHISKFVGLKIKNVFHTVR